MSATQGLASRVVEASFHTLRRLLTRVLASIMALLVAAGLGLVGLLLLLVSVLIVQQSLARIVGMRVRLTDIFALLHRFFGVLAGLSSAGSEA